MPLRGPSGRCAGCERHTNKPWCAACHTRLPPPLARDVATTARAHAAAENAAAAWLAANPGATERDLEILALVADGHTIKDIAAKLGLSLHMVADQIRRLRVRWGCRDAAHLVSVGYQLGHLKVRRPA